MVLLLILIFLLVDWFMTITICCCAIVEIFTSRTLYCRNLWNTFRPNCLKRKRRRQTFRSWWRCTSTRSRRAAEARWPKKKQLRPHLFNIEVEVYVQKYESSPRHDRHSLSPHISNNFLVFFIDKCRAAHHLCFFGNFLLLQDNCWKFFRITSQVANKQAS